MNKDALLTALRSAAEQQRAGRHRDAEQACLAILQQVPEQADALHLVAVLKAQARDFPAAMQWFERACKAAPARADFVGNHANARLEQGDPAAAIALCRQALALDNSRAEVHNVLGSALLACRQLPEAEASFRQALQLQPGFALAWNNLGTVMLRQDRCEAAVQACERALALQPDHVEALVNLGLACKTLGRITEASRCFTKALALRPSAQLEALAAEVSPLWLAPVSGRTLALRRYGDADVDFLLQCFRNAGFMQQYQRYLAVPQDRNALQTQLRELATRHPAQTRAMDWVLAPLQGGVPLGLVNLVDINFAHRRAELLFGIPDPSRRAKHSGLEAMLLVLDFAFNRVGLNKLTSLVYAENAQAQHNTEQIGFSREGLLRQHIYDRQLNCYLDVYTNGLAKADFRSNARLAKLALRWLGRDITRAA